MARSLRSKPSPRPHLLGVACTEWSECLPRVLVPCPLLRLSTSALLLLYASYLSLIAALRILPLSL